MPSMARNTEPRYIRRNKANTLTLDVVSEDRTTPINVDSGFIAVYLRNEQILETLTLEVAHGVGTPNLSVPLPAANTTGKDEGPVLEVWTIVTAEGETDILKDGWLVRYFPTPTLTDQDLLDLHPDLLTLLGATVDKFEKFHLRAWSAILRHLFRRGRRPELNLSPSQLWDVEYHQTMVFIAGYFWTTTGDERWKEERLFQLEMLAKAWGSAVMQYDHEEDGTPDEIWTYPAEDAVRMTRAREPSRRLSDELY